MRCNNIKLTLSIPIRINEPDGNGNVYTEEAVINACKNAVNMPIVQYDSEGKEIPIGVATSVDYSNGFIWVEAKAWHGGTHDLVNQIIDKTITSMEILGFGICL